ncbi:alpha/beta hydrolase [Dyella sp.]|uniref:esterase/lipase family protein n=1 Tax=Dyella sp. TaxID=1869338 RepID=UPI002ED29CEF
MSDHVILLHGLWMRGFSLIMLHRRLMEAGFRVHRFDYMSLASQQERVLGRLHGLMKDLTPATQVHLVGHSLGGLLALRACTTDDDLPPGRIVCMGSPVLGSSAARHLAAMGRGGEALLGHNRMLLENGLEQWIGRREVGMIAGCTPIGLGSMLAHIPGAHDGTVAVAETRLPGLADHCLVEANHTGLLFSPTAARQVSCFLRTGQFEVLALSA